VTLPRCIAVVASALLLAASTAARAQVPVVHVTFAYDHSQSNLFGPQAVEDAQVAATTAALVTLIHKHFKFWPFAAGPGSADDPLLTVSLKLDGNRCDAVLALHKWADASAEELGVVTVYQGTAFPPLLEIGTDAVDAINKHLTEQNRATQIFLPKLANVLALGTTLRIPSSGAPKVIGVLPLKWKDYCSLAGSDFRIEARQQDQTRVTLNSHGIRDSGEWPGPPAYQALQVVHMTMKKETEPNSPTAVKRAVLVGLKPVRFMIEKLTVDEEPCHEVQPESRPAVAPP